MISKQMKPWNEMDLADWEIILSDEEEFLDDGGGNNIYSNNTTTTNSNTSVLVHQLNCDYFIISPDPDPPTHKSNDPEHPPLSVEKTPPTNPKHEAAVASHDEEHIEQQQLVEKEQEVEQMELKIIGAAVALEKMMDDQQDVNSVTASQQQLVEEKQEQEVAHMELTVIPPPALTLEKMVGDQQDISNIGVSHQHLDLYKKMKESLDSATAAFQFEKKDSESELHDDEKAAAPADSDMMMMMIQEHNSNGTIGRRSNDHGGLNKLWKKSLTGIGAICSFGITACIIIFTSTHHMNNNIKLQRPRFQIYTNHKGGFKQVVHIS